MGCDIHAYVEYSTWYKHDGDPYWETLTSNFGGRDYLWFGILADVRHEGDCLYPARGLPENLSYTTEHAEYISVNDEYAKTSDNFVTVGQAKSWGGYDPEKNRVSNPDHHTHSWLSTEELGHCIAKHMEIADYSLDIGWLSLFTAMKTIEENGGKARIVFWFDN